MKLANGLIDFFINVLTFYRDFFKKTYPVAMIFSLFTVVAACLLLLNVPENFGIELRKSGFITQIFKHASSGGTYYIIDLYKIIYLLVCSFFAIGFIKAFYSGNFSLHSMILRLKGDDVFNILFAAIIAGAIDVAMYFMMYNLSTRNLFDEWLWYVLYEVRTYIPLLIFAIAVTRSIFATEVKFRLKHLGLVFACAWLFYVFSYRFAILYKTVFASIMLIPLSFGDTKFIVELILTIPILAFYMIGFTSVFTYPLGFYRLKELNNTESQGNDDAYFENDDRDIKYED